MPIDFICPHCGVAMKVADQYAGNSGPCAHCGKTITIPVPPGVVPSVGFGAPQRRGLSGGAIAAIIIVAVLVVIMAFGGILLALLLPAVQAAREAARRMMCANNLKQIGLAMHNYELKYGCFPPAYLADKNGKPMHSWRVLILPYLEQNNLYEQYRFEEPWDSPHNKALAGMMPSVYRCPTHAEPGNLLTSYAMLVGPHAISDGPRPRRPQDITHGTSNTIMVAEAANEDINWLEPRDLNAENMEFAIVGQGRHGISSYHSLGGHSSGANVLFCDGSVQFLNGSTSKEIIKAMTTIDGAEKPPPDFGSRF
jgi:prepilin-type processing-associated H-X9-DG protein